MRAMETRVWLDAADRDRVRVQFRDGGPIVELRDGDVLPREVFSPGLEGAWLALRGPGECDCELELEVEVEVDG